MKNNKTCQVLSTIDLFHVVQMNHYDDLDAVIYRDGEIAIVEYANVSDSEEYYFSKNAFFVYPHVYEKGLKGKIMEYLFKPSLSYSTHHITNKHPTKLIFFYGWFICFGLICFLVVPPLVRSIQNYKQSYRLIFVIRVFDDII